MANTNSTSIFVPELSRFPTACGVYLMQDAAGTVLYVGKAKNLRNRLRSYYRSKGDDRAQVRLLLGHVAKIDTIVTDTENEALLLENSLIKKHRPRYNIALRDDKTYLSLRLDPKEEFPALQVVRRVVRDGALYFGPYSAATSVRNILKEIYRIFPLRHYPLAACRRRARPCLFHQIGQCSAPCHGLISTFEYAELVRGVVALLSGRTAEAAALLQQRMEAASAALRFEDAARLRDQIRSLAQTVEKQKVAAAGGGDQDVFGLHCEGGEVEVAILHVRQGLLIGRRTLVLEWRLDMPAFLAGVLQQYYGAEVLIPEQVILPFPPEDAPLIEAWLSDLKGKRVRLLVPQRGERVQLVQLAQRNASESFRERGSQRDARLSVLQELQTRLQLKRLPQRIECFDISTGQGQQTVGSMAVLVDGEPAKAEYRRFRVRSVDGVDDYAAQYEILRRRLRRGISDGLLPDLLLIDGGKGQLAVLCAVLEELQLGGQIEAVAIAKSRLKAAAQSSRLERSEERLFRPGRKNPVDIRTRSPEFHLLVRLRDEAHRFAIEYHRRLRNKVLLESKLEQIAGIGPARRRTLLRHFGSLARLAVAEVDELIMVPGINQGLAQRILSTLSTGPELGKKHD